MYTSPTNNGGSPQPRRRSSGAPKRVIRSGEVRYPDNVTRTVNARSAADPSRRLRPARDAGIYVELRAARQRRAATLRRRNRSLAVAMMLVATLIAVIAWQTSSDKRAAAQSLNPPTTTRTSAPKTSATATNRSQTAVAEPTPLLASYKTVRMRLPVSVNDLTEVGFHQASYSYALHMKSYPPDADMDEARADKGTHRDLTKQRSGSTARLTGFVLRMWRPRAGKPDSALDVGAKPGSAVLAPLTGTVVLVKKYKLYGTHPDYQIHIQPDGHPEVDCVLIHITDPTVKAGDEVEAGITRLGSVRKLSDSITLQLGEFTDGGGDHVHVQLNNTNDPTYEGLKGALSLAK